MIRRYQQLAGKCKTINQLNQVHIALENEMTPDEIVTFGRQLAARKRRGALVRRLTERLEYFKRRALLEEDARAWIGRLNDILNYAGKTDPEPYVRSALNAHLNLYSAPGIDRKTKTLLVCFTGINQRMMMHIHLLLQHFDASKYDLLVVKYPKQKKVKGYLKGLPGMGDDLLQSLDALADLVGLRGYDKRMALGVSGGAFPAVMMALRHRFDVGAAVSIASPWSPGWQQALGKPPGVFVQELYGRSDKRTRLTLVVGAESDRDIPAAEGWQGWLPGLEIKTVKLDAEEVKHNVLWPLARNGKLQPLLQEILACRQKNIGADNGTV